MTVHFAKIVLILSVFVLPPLSIAQTPSEEAEKTLKALIDIQDTFIGLNSILLKDRKDEEIIKLAQESVKGELKDPDSANFRNEKIIRNEKGLYVCGEVNAKNSYGGYVGFMPYFSSVVGSSNLMTNDEHSAANFIVPHYCF